MGGFSYGDLAKELQIKAPSIHHHFPRKEALIAAVAEQYRADFLASVHAIESGSATDRLHGYAGLFSAASSNEMLCLCGAVAAEWTTVGDASHAIVEGFFDDQLTWLRSEIQAGIDSGEFRSDLDAVAAASGLLAALEGALLMVRANGGNDLPRSTAATMVSLMQAADVDRGGTDR